MKPFATLLLTTALGGTAFAQALEVTPTGVAYGLAGTRTETKDDAGQLGGRSGFYETGNPNPASSWYPGASGWQHLIEARHHNTTTNNYALQIAGGFGDQNLWFRKTNNNPSSSWNKVVAENSAGNVGIGTNPSSPRLEVFRGELSSDPGIRLSSNGGWLSINARSPQGAWSPLVMEGDKAFIFTNGQPETGNLSIGSWSSSTKGIRIVGDSGNVGIGTPTPGRKLDVAGNASIGVTSQNYNPSGGNWNYTLLLNSDETTSIGFHDSWASVSSIRYNHNGFTIGADDGWGMKNVYMPANVGIGTFNPTHRLTVNGEVKSRGFITDNGGWSDYVFADDYKLATLDEVEAHIKEKRHLPGVPSEAEVLSKGLDLGQMSAVQMAKIEELMLHVIALNKKMEAQAEQVKAQAEEIRLLKSARKEQF